MLAADPFLNDEEEMEEVELDAREQDHDDMAPEVEEMECASHPRQC